MIMKVDDDHLNFLMVRAWEMTYDISAAQNFCTIDANTLTPVDMTLIVDWLVAARIMSGNEPPPLAVVMYASKSHLTHDISLSIPIVRIFEDMHHLKAKP